ncbi:serine/threonine protein kinase [Caldimonas brevitalea]|uniref:Serine/threonine protein kinase n=1 Tax=Caldimonas brevitalea TaxID=413882 RepID=A0A0G3BN67_9BURK|nr:serine/threonine protein kinase [Caldimonas brevitalea]
MLADALTLPPSQWSAFVTRVAAEDAVLAEELGSMMEATAPGRASQVPAAVAMAPALDAPDGVLRIGQQFWPYRIVALIGRGGMGEVYRAERADGLYEQQVAIKLARDGDEQEASISRLQAERRLLSRLDHPQVPKVLDSGVTDDGWPYFVMELIDGEPIDVYVDRHQLPVEQRLHLFCSVCRVVHFAHGRGVVHRDLKPSNLLVTPQGDVKLLDFGVAKQVDTEPSAATSEITGGAATLAYASPEQVECRDITTASDVYSLGVLLYRLLGAVSPYSTEVSGSDHELVEAIRRSDPLPPSVAVAPARLPASLQRDLDAIALMALRKEPVRRYATAEQFGADVLRCLARLPVSARRDGWGYRIRRFLLRHRAAFGMALVGASACAGILVTAVQRAYETQQQRERAERRLDALRQLANVSVSGLPPAQRNRTGSGEVREDLAQGRTSCSPPAGPSCGGR